MSCHSQIWTEQPDAGTRCGKASRAASRWPGARIHDLPDFVYFHHGIHVQKGVGCAECHGRIDQMPLTCKDKPLTMEWCLECHRHPENARPAQGQGLRDGLEARTAIRSPQGQKLIEEYHVPTDRLTNCSVCHR